MAGKWTIEEVDIAFNLHMQGLKYTEIGEKLGRTGKSVRTKLEWQGLNPRRRTTEEERQIIKRDIVAIADKLELPVSVVAGAVGRMHREKVL